MPRSWVNYVSPDEVSICVEDGSYGQRFNESQHASAWCGIERSNRRSGPGDQRHSAPVGGLHR